MTPSIHFVHHLNKRGDANNLFAGRTKYKTKVIWGLEGGIVKQLVYENMLSCWN